MTTHLLIPFVLGGSIALALWLTSIRRSRTKGVRAREGKLVGVDGRQWGKWEPVDWKYPPVRPWDDFDLETTKPPPYRAFKYQHLTTMGIRSMPFDEWFEVDNQFPTYLRLRQDRYRTRGRKVCQTLPGAELAARELCLSIAEYTTQRYPALFKVSRRGKGWFGEDEIREVEVLGLGVRWDFDQEDPMAVAGLMVQDDLAVMMEGGDGMYYFKAGFVALAGSWRLEDKIGRDLRYIHMSGDVPEYMSKLDMSMNRFFQKLRLEKPVARNNYTFVRGSELAWETSAKGPEDLFDQLAKGPSTKALRQAGLEPSEPADPSEIWLRQERQTLRRLPRSGAVVFTVHSYLEPIVDMLDEPGVPGRMASTVRSWKGDVYKHKNGELYHSLLPCLDAQHAKQVAAGVTVEGKASHEYPY